MRFKCEVGCDKNCDKTVKSSTDKKKSDIPMMHSAKRSSYCAPSSFRPPEFVPLVGKTA